MDKNLKAQGETIDNKPDNANALAGEGNAAPKLHAGADKHDFGKHPPIAAERIFDGAVYGVWNYGLQVGASVLAAMWFTKGGGKKYFDKAESWLGENVISKVTNKTGVEAAKEAHTPLIFVALIMVGNFFIPPIQYLERHKDKYVSHINNFLNARRTARGNPPSESELRVQQEAIHAIAREPKQTSASLWGGRFLGLGANFLAAFAVGEKRNVAMKTKAADIVTSGLKTVGMKGLAESEKVRTFSEIAFLDYGYSIISANVIYLYSHLINPPKYTNGHEKHDAAEKASAVLPHLPPHQIPEVSPSLPEPELLSGSKFTQLKPINPELIHSHDQQLAL